MKAKSEANKFNGPPGAYLGKEDEMATVIRRNSYPESVFMYISLENGREIEGTVNEGTFKPSNYNPLSDAEAKEIASDLNCNVRYSSSQLYNFGEKEVK